MNKKFEALILVNGKALTEFKGESEKRERCSLVGV